MSKRREISNSRSSTRAEGDVLERAVEDRLADGAHRGFHLVDARAVRHPAGLHVQLRPRGGSRGRTPRGSSPQDSAGRAGRACRRCRSPPPRSAARAGSAISTKIFPGCMSAWKKLCRNTCVKKMRTPFSARLRDVGAAVAQAREVADRHAMDALHDHDLGAAVVPVHFRHVEQLGAGEVALQLRGVGGLAHEVEFIEDGLLVLRARSRRGRRRRPSGQ